MLLHVFIIFSKTKNFAYFFCFICHHFFEKVNLRKTFEKVILNLRKFPFKKSSINENLKYIEMKFVI
jgi:hypothetical protein